MIYLIFFFAKRKGDVALLYHSIGRVDRNVDPYKLNVSPEDFAKHLKIISKYNRKIAITFDDGYGNNFENAFPLLKKYNFNATIFLITDFIDGKIGSENFGGENFKVRPLTWQEIKAMDRTGVKFGSHSKTHSPMTKLSEDELKKEALESKRHIERALGHQIDTFAYPFGDATSFNNMVKEAVREAGYNKAYSNIMGCNREDPDDKFALRRIRIYREDGPFKLKMKISGAYDWVDVIGSTKRTRR